MRPWGHLKTLGVVSIKRFQSFHVWYFHYKDKTFPPPYPYNENLFTAKTTSDIEMAPCFFRCGGTEKGFALIKTRCKWKFFIIHLIELGMLCFIVAILLVLMDLCDILQGCSTDTSANEVTLSDIGKITTPKTMVGRSGQISSKVTRIKCNVYES